MTMVARHNARRDLDPQSTAVLARVAHEMRQPLSAAIAAVSLIKQGDDVQRHARACGVLERQCTRLSRLLEDLIVATQISYDIIALRHEQLDLGCLVADIGESLQPLVADKQQRLDVHVPVPPCWISGDQVRLEQVFSNVLTNAMKYTDPGGRLWAIVVAEESAATVTLGDSGHGITAEMLPHVFEMFTAENENRQGSDR